MSNTIPQYTQVRSCTLPPWDLYKTNKFGNKSADSRLSIIKSCSTRNSTANSTFKGSGMGGSAAGYSQVQSSGGRTNKLSSFCLRCSNKEKKEFEAQRVLSENERKKKKKKKKKK
jgi:hypothetical protein